MKRLSERAVPDDCSQNLVVTRLERVVLEADWIVHDVTHTAACLLASDVQVGAQADSQRAEHTFGSGDLCHRCLEPEVEVQPVAHAVSDNPPCGPRAGINWNDLEILSEAGVNWNDLQVISKKGINWNDLQVLTKAGVNWNDLQALSKAGVNWNDLEVISKTGVNWNDLQVLTKTGVNWNDLEVLSETGINWARIEVISKTGIDWADIRTLSTTGIN